MSNHRVGLGSLIMVVLLVGCNVKEDVKDGVEEGLKPITDQLKEANRRAKAAEERAREEISKAKGESEEKVARPIERQKG